MTIVDGYNGYLIAELDHREQIAHGYIYGVVGDSGKLEDSDGAMTLDEALQTAATKCRGGMRRGRHWRTYRKA